MESDYENYNLTASEFESDWEYNWPMILTNVLQGPATVIGLLANAFLLFIFAVTPRLRTPPNALLLQRAITDIISLLPFPFIIYYRVVGFSDINVYLCKFLSLLTHIGAVGSLVFLMGLAIYNYQASNPEQSFPRLYRVKTIRIVSILAWILAVIAGLAAFFLTYLGYYCDFAPLYNHFRLEHIFMQLSILLILPLVVVWVLFSIVWPTRSSGEESNDIDGDVNESANPRLLLGLASVFTVLHTIYWFFIVLQFVTPHVLSIIISITSSLAIYMEAFNAILVMYLSRQVRQEVVAWLIPSRRRTDALPLK